MTDLTGQVRIHMTRWICFTVLFFSLSCNNITSVSTEPAHPRGGLLLTNHPLVDSIFDVDGKRMLDKSQLFEKLAGAGYVLLGEHHDNISHHKNQALIIDFLATMHRTTSVAFEMIDDIQGNHIKGRQTTSPDKLTDLLNHFDTGWEYDNYRPVFDSVIRAGFGIYPANIEINKLRNIIMQGNADVPAETSQILSSTPLAPELEIQMQKDIIKSHCDMLSMEQALPMVQAQRIRDATMASSLLNSSSDLRILIAGNGHVRRDSGVPVYILAQDKSAAIVSIGMIETAEGKNNISAYEKDWDGDELPFNYAWFTARAYRDDPCIEFIKFIRQHNEND